MNWFMLTLTATASLLLWRDFRSGRVYHLSENSFPIRRRKFYIGRSESWYKQILGIMAVLCFLGLLASVLPVFAGATTLDSDNAQQLSSVRLIGLTLYVINGLLGRLFSWVVNYGSVDRKW